MGNVQGETATRDVMGRSVHPRTFMAVAALVVVGLGGLDPIGWDRYGPIRWAIIPALGFWAIAGGMSSIRFAKTPMHLMWAALLGWGALASVFAADPLHAWIGTPDRRFGWLTWLLCGGLFLLTRAAGSEERRLVVKGFVVGSIAIGAHLLVGTLTSLTLGSDGSYFGQRFGAQFGQPAYLGAAAALALPICAGLAGDREATDRWRIAAWVAVASTALALLLSRSRAAWLGALVAGILWLAVNAIASGRQKREDTTRSGLRTGATLMALGVAVVVGVPGFRRRFTSATGDGGVIQGRIDEWQVGLRALGDSPLFGHGAEGYRTVFGVNVDADYIRDWGYFVITDRAHNGLLDVGLSFGVPGAIAYAALIMLVIAGAVSTLRSADPLRVGLGAGVIGYAIQQQFLFPLSEVDPMFWVAVGLITADRSSAFLSTTAESVLRGLTVGLAMVATVAGVLDLVANARLDSAIEQDRVASVTRWRPDSIRYHFIAARTAENAGDLDRALEHLEDGLDLSPQDPAFRHGRARILLNIARATPEGPSREQRIAQALEALTGVAEEQPLHGGVLQLLGTAQALDGQFDTAVATLALAVDLSPGNEAAMLNLQEAERLRDAADDG